MELTAAEPRRRGLVQLFLDGEAAVKLDAQVFLQSGLKPGDQVSDQELFELIQASDARRAQEKALYLLEYRNYSKRELTEKIARTAASREAAQAAAGRMEELGLVDDRRFAQDYARELFGRKGYGSRRVAQELRRRGIGQELIQELLAEYEDPERAGEAIRRVLAKKYPGWREDEKVRRRAFVALQRLGYSYQEVREAMGQGEDWE
ncbi:MAG TPA: recombination regulator RecX [Candidatus Acutalibacter stercorigallinarum]|nr:recombination regulator RecX [Candidatus Acutalibacter stercorigallinarum]